MIAQMVLSAKCLSTLVARVGPLVSVSSLVDQKVVRLGELSEKPSEMMQINRNKENC